MEEQSSSTQGSAIASVAKAIWRTICVLLGLTMLLVAAVMAFVSLRHGKVELVGLTLAVIVAGIGLLAFFSERIGRSYGRIVADAKKDANDPNEVASEREFQEQLIALAPRTWVVYSLVGANILIWVATLFFGAGFLQSPAERLLVWGGNAASEVQRGEWWRLLSATFLHNGALHVFMNMLGLIGSGVVVERIYGHRLFALIYLGSGLLGSAFSLYFSAQRTISVGASGAVFGVVGALLVAVYQHRKTLPKLFAGPTMHQTVIFIVYSLQRGVGHQGIDNAAHVGGLLGGCLLAYMLPERFDMAYFRKTVARRAVMAVVGVVAVTAGITAMAPKAAIDLGGVIAGEKLLGLAMQRASDQFQLLQQEAQDVQAGKISERDAEERSRAVHAPVFRQSVEDLSRVKLYPQHPLEPSRVDFLRLCELVAESLAMESVFNEKSGKYEPVDPVRMAQLEAELKKAIELVKTDTQSLNERTKRSN